MEDHLIIEIIPNDKSESAVKAYAEITFASSLGEFTITGYKVIQKENKPEWVAMPEIRVKQDNNEYKSFTSFIPSRVFKKNITEKILSEYRKSAVQVDHS